MSRRIGLTNKKAFVLVKPSKRIVFITGVESPSEEQVALAQKAIQTAVDNNCVILTGDRDGIEAEVIRWTNTKKYRKIIVMGALGNCRYFSNYGINHADMWMGAQRDDICATRSGTMVAIGTSASLDETVQYARNLGHAVYTK